MKRTNADALLRRAGQTLHDDIAPALVAAGLHLQLIRMDHPATATQVNEVLAVLEGAVDHVRQLSQTLAPSPFTPNGS
jgi:signal transduction histidine kinase